MQLINTKETENTFKRGRVHLQAFQFRYYLKTWKWQSWIFFSNVGMFF